jgi:hypothetical protein
MAPGDVSFFGETTSRAQYRRFGIRQSDRLSHVHILGKTGVGKSGLLELLAREDVSAGRGFALIDPHGDLVERLAASLPSRILDRITYLDAADPTQPFGYNPLRRVRHDAIPLAASGLIETFRKLWPDAWGVRMEHVLRNSLYVLLEREGSTLPDLLRLYADKAFRKQVTAKVRNEVVRDFWRTEFEKYPDRYRLEVVAPIQNKLGALLADPTVRRILVNPKIDLHLRKLIDADAIMLVNLPKGRLGEDASALLGSVLVSTIGLAALSRADTPGQARRPFFLYVDEFHAFTTLSFISLMSELRKYGLGLTLAHQHLQQLESEVRHAVLGNAGTFIAFRLGAEDAAYVAREFQPTISTRDLINLPNRHLYLRLMIDGAPSAPFSARTLEA